MLPFSDTSFDSNPPSHRLIANFTSWTRWKHPSRKCETPPWPDFFFAFSSSCVYPGNHAAWGQRPALETRQGTSMATSEKVISGNWSTSIYILSILSSTFKLAKSYVTQSFLKSMSLNSLESTVQLKVNMGGFCWHPDLLSEPPLLFSSLGPATGNPAPCSFAWPGKYDQQQTVGRFADRYFYGVK